MEKSTVLKTSFRGFDKKAVMDYIEQLQAENMALKDRVAALEAQLDGAVPKQEEAPQTEAPAVEEPVPAADAAPEESALPKDEGLADLAAEFAPAAEEPAEEPKAEEPKEEPKMEDQISALEEQLEAKLSALVTKYSAKEQEASATTIGGSKGYRIKVKVKEEE